MLRFHVRWLSCYVFVFTERSNRTSPTECRNTLPQFHLIFFFFFENTFSICHFNSHVPDHWHIGTLAHWHIVCWSAAVCMWTSNVSVLKRVAHVDEICLAGGKDQCRAFASTVINWSIDWFMCSVKAGEFLQELSDCYSKEDCNMELLS